MPAQPLPEFRLRPEPRSDRARNARGYQWATPDIGTRHQLGGTPRWLQDDETPHCGSCDEPMTFYAQLDGIGDDYDLADCGLLYVFVCFACLTTQSILQPG